MSVRADIKSYVLRGGRITVAQKRALKELWHHYGQELSPSPPDWALIFGSQAQLMLEIGSGYGDATKHYAQQFPQCGHIAIEVHPPGIGSLLNKLATSNLQNVRIIRADAKQALPQMFAHGALHCVRILFPDPWPKKRHHKRRLINPAFTELLAQKIAPGGYIHIATDCASYADHIQQTFAAHCAFHPSRSQHHPPRPPTKFALRAQNQNASAQDLFYQRI